MNTYRIVAFAAAAFASTVAISSTVHAEETRIDSRATYRASELSTEAGQKAVFQRIRLEARRACLDDAGGSLTVNDCARDLSNQMIHKLGSRADLAARIQRGAQVASR